MVRIKILISSMAILLFTLSPSLSAGQMEGMPAAKVAVSEIEKGSVPPYETFVGTVYYREVSDVASEVSGIVESVGVEEAQRVEAGDLFVTLNADILGKKYRAARAAYEQVLAELKQASVDFDRIERLYREESVSTQAHDESRLRRETLEKRAMALQAEMEGLGAEVAKKTIRAPFGGVILKRWVDRGEWIAPGEPVATLARDDEVDVIADVPGRTIRHVRPGSTVSIEAGGMSWEGTVVAVVQRGDVSTRTFPVKVRVKNSGALMEGMEARVTLPAGEERPAFLVSRDALISAFGADIVFTVVESKAKSVPVRIIGFEGGRAGIEGEGLQEGMAVVVKGNERIRDGQPVEVVE